MANTISALQAARLLAQYAERDKVEDLTPLKLQKILYYVEGWHLGNDAVQDELFSEPVLAWEYGPVYRAVYNRFRGTTACIKAADLKDVDPINSQTLKKNIDSIWKAYKNKSALDLINLTHDTTPYKVAYANKLDNMISKLDMKEYFHKLAHES